MERIGRKIYYDKTTGEPLVDTGEREGLEGLIAQTTIEQDIATYRELSERNRDSFDVIELGFGQYFQDFMECTSYRVNPETKQMEFSYPNPNVPPEEQEPVYQKSLSEQVKTLEATILEMSTYSANQDERLSTQEQALLELTSIIAGGNA